MPLSSKHSYDELRAAVRVAGDYVETYRETLPAGDRGAILTFSEYVFKEAASRACEFNLSPPTAEEPARAGRVRQAITALRERFERGIGSWGPGSL
jgi:hypothetical protein